MGGGVGEGEVGIEQLKAKEGSNILGQSSGVQKSRDIKWQGQGLRLQRWADGIGRRATILITEVGCLSSVRWKS